MAETFKTGDVVRLKSGGPHMTVEHAGEHYGEPTVWCVWFEKTKKHEGTFAPDTLELVPKGGAARPEVIMKRP